MEEIGLQVSQLDPLKILKCLQEETMLQDLHQEKILQDLISLQLLEEQVDLDRRVELSSNTNI